MQKVRDIDNHCLVTCQQRAAACELPHTKSCAVLGSMYHVTAKITPATAVAGFHNHKDILVGVLNQVLTLLHLRKSILLH